ncbi:MAG: ion transporter [bacterium]|nr:ion transporter [bacterium]
MKKWYSYLEILIDRLVPLAVIILLAIIIIELFFHTIAENYHTLIQILDYNILGIFIVDLIFKYNRIRKWDRFLRECWLDIIAIFPFFLVFRVFESVLIFTELPKEFRQFQLILHEGVVLSEGSAKVIREAEEAGKVSRIKTIIRMFRGLENSPRIIKALAFYEQPVGKHHLHEVQGKKEYKAVKKFAEKEERIIEKDIKKGVKAIEKDINKVEKKLTKKK